MFFFFFLRCCFRGGGELIGKVEWGDFLLFAEAFTLSHMQNFLSVTPCVIRVCIFLSTVVSSPIVSAKRLCIR